MLLPLLGCQRDEEGSNPAQNEPVVHAGPVAADMARDYKELIKINAQPIQVNLNLAMLCRLPVPEDFEAARANYGPHALASINVYVNELARDAMIGRTYDYPEGSVIVKEKHRSSFGITRSAEGDGWTGDGVGGMIKRAEGSSPESGDWEFFYTDAAQPLEAGPIASCVDCHRKVTELDWVFGSWAKEEFFKEEGEGS